MVDKKKKKSKRKTKKRISREMIKIVVNNYLNNRDLRRQRRRQAQQKRNPQNRLGGAYPIQNKAIDSISYSNQFRHTNDTRLMALERGITDALTGNVSILNQVVRQNGNLPLLDNKPHLPAPSQQYLIQNPNYPAGLIEGKSVDVTDEAFKQQPRDTPEVVSLLSQLTNKKTQEEQQQEQKEEAEQQEEKIDQPDPLTRAASDKVEKDLEKEKKGGGKSVKEQIEDPSIPEQKKKIKISKKPDKDYGPRPTQQAIFSAMPEKDVIMKAKFYGMPESEIAKYTTTNRDGETIIVVGRLRAFKVAILNRAREVTKPASRGRPVGS